MRASAEAEQCMPKPEEVEAGQAVYSPMVLRTYDWVVLGLSNHLLWRCSTAELRRLYDRNVSARHLDIGVGTGYFLDKATWPVADPDITLLDLNPNCLVVAAKRIRRYAPKAVLANILEPLPPHEAFKSASLCYLLHCVPGTIREKAVAFDHLRPLLAPGARVFGATILQGRVPRSRPAQALMNLYNRKGIFSNAADTLEDLETALNQRFSSVKLEMKGVVALFEATAD
jgi:ubiquinone/menaquinone biosynthesis C-methylase UbiE